MCGIFCTFCKNVRDNLESQEFLSNLNNSCFDLLKRRGPDHTATIHCEIEAHSFLFSATVLWLQGKHLTKQPVESKSSKLIYNGDVFGGKINAQKRRQTGDTVLFLENLDESENVSVALSQIQGPYAFVYLNEAKRKLYFGRDVYGRRSLLIGLPNSGSTNRNFDSMVLSSVAPKETGCNFMELPAIGTFCYDLQDGTLHVSPWKYKNENFLAKLNELSEFTQKNIQINQEIPAIERPVFTKPNQADLKLFENLGTLNFDSITQKLLSNKTWFCKVEKLRELLENAVQERIGTQPEFCRDCIFGSQKCDHALVGVLFSGGLDCSILALLADQFSDKNRPIDLLNVAFDRAKDYQSPDRLTGLETLNELRKLRPQRVWNFVEINVGKEELDLERYERIRHLIYPLNTVLDDSLGCALWFAGRGQKYGYISPCRVLLVGMGADELFGGYTRHRNAMKRHGWEGLHKSLDEDWQNISHRNLARDDRVISDQGKQLRTPYLDEEFVEYVQSLHSWERSCPREDIPQGIGEKILLRSLAYHLGLKNASTFKKRALQFGSRIANSKENAQDVSPRL